MIEFRNVTKKFGSATNSTVALDDISFFIEKGSFVFLIGPTGSGKTTIFRLAIRDLLPTSGEIFLSDVNIVKLPHKKIPVLRRKIGVVFQDLKILMDRTVMENVILPLQIGGINDESAKKKTDEILSSVGLSEKKNSFPVQLSGGEKQRIAIARALIFEPEIILADEPTGNLDLDTSLQIIDIFESINQSRGTTILMATHNVELLAKTKRRMIKLQVGKIIEDTQPAQRPVPIVEETPGREDAASTEEKNSQVEEKVSKEKEGKKEDVTP